MTAPSVLTIVVSTTTTCAGILSIIAKKISTCTSDKLREYMLKLHTATTAYTKLCSHLSLYLSDGKISDEEFQTIMRTYDEAFVKENNSFSSDKMEN